MRREQVRSQAAASPAAEAGRWADRLERRPWRWFTKRRLLVGVAIVVALLLSAQQWSQYRQVAHAGVPVPACSSTEREVQYDVRWQWFPPGLVCVFGDGTRTYVGL